MRQGRAVRALIDGKTMKYQTGLSDEDIKYVNEELNYKVNLSDGLNSGGPHPFWDSRLGKIILEPQAMFLDTKTPLGFIHYKMLLKSPFVANSEEEYLDGKYQEATHIIFDKEVNAETEARRIALKNKVRVEVAKLSTEKKRHLLMVLQGVDYTNKSDNFLSIGINTLEEKKPMELLELIQKDSEYVTIKSTVLKAISQNLITRVGLQYHFNGISVGTSVENVVKRLLKDENQDVLSSILDAFK